MRKALKKATLVSALVTLVAMMAFPAVSSADPALWVEADGSPLGSYSANGATGYEDRATANVAGHISIYVNHHPAVPINAECDVTGEIELWNDGPDYSPGKNQFVDLDGANCEGTIGACQVTGMSSNDLPWVGDLVSSGWSGYGDSNYDVDIRWLRGSCSQFATTGTLEVLNIHDTQSGGCLDEMDLDQATLSTAMGTADVSGSLDVQSIDGLSNPPVLDCVIGYPL